MGKYDKFLKDYEQHAQRIKKSSAFNIHENEKDKSARIKHLESKYHLWFEYYFNSYASSKCSWFHKRAAAKIIENPVIFILLEWFRGAAKSVHVCMGIPLYLMVKGELKFMLLIGFNEKKAKRLLSDIQIQLKYNQKFINDYGNLFQFGDWSDGDLLTTQGVRFSCMGLGQDPRGLREGENRPDYIVPDDIDNKKKCRNQALIKEAVEYITDDLWGCFAGVGNMRFVMSNNLIHKKSILAHLKNVWKSLNDKAKEKNRKPVHHHMKVNLRNNKGASNWPERFSEKQCDKLIDSRPYRSSQREYFNNPIEDGKIFKRENLQYKKMLRLSQYDSLVIYGDLSYKDTGDFKALKFWGKTGREYHLIDCFVRQTSRREAAIWLYDLFEDLKNISNHLNIKVKIEGLFAQDEFVSEFDDEGDDRGWWVDVVADKRPKANKFDRIESTSPKYERRRVYYNIVKKDSADFEEAESQLFAFEKGSGAPDDSPDADHGAFDELDRSTYIDNFEPRITLREPKSKTY